MMQQILVGLGALIDPLENSPGFLAGSSNNSFSAGNSNKLWVWNNRKGIALVGSDIRNYSGGGASRSNSTPGYWSGDTETFSVPSAIDWAYCVCIGGGGGGNGVGAGDGGGGGGYAFAKIDLRPSHGTTIDMRAGRGSSTHTSPNSEPSWIRINGSEVVRGNRGSTRPGSAGPSAGGTGDVDTSNPIVLYSYTATGGEGRDGNHGYPGATGGGAGSGFSGGESTMPWCGGGSGGDGGGPGGGPGNSNVNFTNSNLYDSLRGVHAVPSDTFQYSLVSNLPFFGDASSQSAFDGKQGRSTTSPGDTAAGFFGSGGGGSGSGSGFYGGPGAVIMWWS